MSDLNQLSHSKKPLSLQNIFVYNCCEQKGVVNNLLPLKCSVWLTNKVYFITFIWHIFMEKVPMTLFFELADNDSIWFFAFKTLKMTKAFPKE